jgi:hypothetical protein
MLTFDRKRHTAHAAERERGQSLVEAAFGLIVMVMIMAGLLDLGRAYYTFVALEDAAGEAAIYLSVFPDCPSDGTNNGLASGTRVSNNGVAGSAPFPEDCDPPNNAMWRAEEAAGGVIEWSNAVTTVTFSPNPGSTSAGEIVNVTISYDFVLLMPIIPEIAGSPTLRLTAQASQIVITE